MPVSSETISAIKFINEKMMPYLDEKQRRLFLAAEAEAIGHGGITSVREISGASRNTISSGVLEMNQNDSPENSSSDNRIRKKGAGRKTAREKNPGLYEKIELIVREQTYGTPTKILLWTTLSLRKIASELKVRYNIDVSQNVVSRALDALGYSKQKNQKNLQVGEQHPDRNAQFEFINNTANSFIKEGEPVISVDTKKKELVGNFKNEGAEYRKEKDARKVLDHDFPIPELGKVAPYGIYVLNDNTGFVNLGTDHDTAEFAAESIFRWWEIVGKNTFPNATKIYITADSGGSNGVRVHMWKYALQQFADRTGLEVHVSHYPSGTSKWNKVEHRLFCYISKNWQGKPLINIETIVSLISSTTTTKGLRVICKVDENRYELKRKVSDEEMKAINLERCETLGYWNYIIRPRETK